MKAWKFGVKDRNTDVIVPARYLNTSVPTELAKHLMEDSSNREFLDFYASGKNSVEGDVFVGPNNFGEGSSREHAPLAIKTAGIKYVIAESFARIFYRNSFNIGLMAIECHDAGKIRDLARMHQHVLAVARPEPEPPEQFDDLGMDIMDAEVEGRFFALLFHG